MSTPESRVKQFIDKKMKDWFPQAIKESPGGGMFHKSGQPDRKWLIPSGDKRFPIVVCIEAKAVGGKATDLQVVTLMKYAARGAISAIVVGNDLAHMERIRDEVNRRIELIREVSKAHPV